MDLILFLRAENGGTDMIIYTDAILDNKHPNFDIDQKVDLMKNGLIYMRSTGNKAFLRYFPK